jgi:hypothetical protein
LVTGSSSSRKAATRRADDASALLAFGAFTLRKGM